jgi:hypothetical protein
MHRREQRKCLHDVEEIEAVGVEINDQALEANNDTGVREVIKRRACGRGNMDSGVMGSVNTRRM